MNTTPIVPGDTPLVENRYNYNSQKVLGFIATLITVSTEQDNPSLSCFPDNYYHVSICHCCSNLRDWQVLQ